MLGCYSFFLQLNNLHTRMKSQRKHLHEHTIHLLIYVHACILRASLCKKARCCQRNFDVCLVVIGIKDVWKMEPNVTKFKFNIP